MTATATATALTLDYTADPLYRALLRGVLVQPADDTRRLVIADFIEEAGDADRAEFIRVACEAEVIQDAEPHRANELLEHNFKWRGNAGMVGCNYGNVTWRRGFVNKIECTLSAFMSGNCSRCGGHGGGPNRYEPSKCSSCNGTGTSPGLVDTLFAAHPVTEVVLSDVPIRSYSARPWFYVSSPPLIDPMLKTPLNGLFDTVQEAKQAVSRWAVDLGRSRAKLGPLASGLIPKTAPELQ